jgi:hypothetical protein
LFFRPLSSVSDSEQLSQLEHTEQQQQQLEQQQQQLEQQQQQLQQQQEKTISMEGLELPLPQLSSFQRTRLRFLGEASLPLVSCSFGR